MENGAEERWVLIVDDSRQVREAVSHVVSLLGFKVAQASSGAEALVLFSRRAFDLILTDLQMPGMDGLNLASRIKGESPATPVVLITGSVREAVEKRMASPSVDGVVYKPFSLEELADVVISFTDRGSRTSIDPAGARPPLIHTGA